jgi:hypothetical protein
MVEITHYETANKNKAIGYVDIRVPIIKPTVLIFRKISHIQSGDRRWFNFPSFSRQDSSNEKIYHKFSQFETEAYNGQLLECLTQKVKDYCEEHGITQVEQMDFDSFPQEMGSDAPFEKQ